MQPAIILMLLVPLLGRTQAPKISLIKSILLPGVKGKFDHIAIDNVSQNLFLTAKGINSVEIIDLVRGKITHSIKSVSAPQGLLYIPGKKLLLVCGGGTVKGFDVDNYQQKFTNPLGEEADNIRYSPATKMIYVAYGYGALAVIDSRSFNKN